MEIIGICGKKGSGKTTLAAQISSTYSGVEHVAFGKFLKTALIAMGLPTDLFYNPELKEVPHRLLQGKTPRHAMVTLGTEWGRDMIGQDFWVDLWVNHLNKLPDTALVLVDDVRFREEVDIVRDLGGVLVNVSKSTVPTNLSWWEKLKTHRSEQLDPVKEGIPTILNVLGDPSAMLKEFNRLYDQHRGT